MENTATLVTYIASLIGIYIPLAYKLRVSTHVTRFLYIFFAESKKTFSVVTSLHIYSVQRCKLKVESESPLHFLLYSTLYVTIICKWKCVIIELVFCLSFFVSVVGFQFTIHSWLWYSAKIQEWGQRPGQQVGSFLSFLASKIGVPNFNLPNHSTHRAHDHSLWPLVILEKNLIPKAMQEKKLPMRSHALFLQSIEAICSNIVVIIFIILSPCYSGVWWRFCINNFASLFPKPQTTHKLNPHPTLTKVLHLIIIIYYYNLFFILCIGDCCSFYIFPYLYSYT